MVAQSRTALDTPLCNAVLIGGLAERLGERLQSALRQFKSGTHFCGVEQFGRSLGS